MKVGDLVEVPFANDSGSLLGLVKQLYRPTGTNREVEVLVLFRDSKEHWFYEDEVSIINEGR
jgi:hypothetical protein